MSDRISAVLMVPRDDALPMDVQAVNHRREVINLMKEIGEIDENSVRYKNATDQATISLGDNMMTCWQHNLIAVLYYADGKANKEIGGPIIHQDYTNRRHSCVRVERNPYA
ncbi:hypothetical protein MycrhDRAFT_5776 [Mycolicibacterium rhodesiae JS60]|nr:hypothetical protein MycrhDRAFT_5776 [Mycolicibacterium rhodesiae JS60]